MDGGKILVGAGAGSYLILRRLTFKPMVCSCSEIGIGLSAKCLEEGGADLILIYNSGHFRMAGRGSLAGMMPYSDANAVVVDMVRLPWKCACNAVLL